MSLKQVFLCGIFCLAPAGLLQAEPMRDVVSMVNKLRAENGLHALNVSPQLEKAADLHASDMARRGVHNEAAELLKDRLEGKVDVDFATARRLFTLICVLHIRG